MMPRYVEPGVIQESKLDAEAKRLRALRMEAFFTPAPIPQRIRPRSIQPTTTRPPSNSLEPASTNVRALR